MAFYQGGPVVVRLSYLAATAILVVFIVSVGANVVHVNAGQPHPLTGPPQPGGCIEGQKSVQEWCPGQEYKEGGWKRAKVCHNGQLVQETHDCSTATQTETQTAQCGAGDPPKVTEWCPVSGTGWKTREICKNGVWQKETNPQRCPQCNAGDPPKNVVYCEEDPEKWMTREVCTNGAWQRETNPKSCPECMEDEEKCTWMCTELPFTTQNTCESGYICQSGRWQSFHNECCYIATATFGSALSPEVQLLRNFRDRDVLQTFAGGNFMRVFNMVYYSFSPQVAHTISTNENLRTTMRYVLYPLIGILWATQQIYSAFAFGPEGAVVIAGLFAGSLIGLVYASPVILGVSFAIARAFRRRPTRAHVYMSLPFFAIATSLIIVSELTRFEMLMQVSTGLLMLTTWALPGIALSAWALNRR